MNNEEKGFLKGYSEQDSLAQMRNISFASLVGYKKKIHRKFSLSISSSKYNIPENMIINKDLPLDVSIYLSA